MKIEFRGWDLQRKLLRKIVNLQLPIDSENGNTIIMQFTNQHDYQGKKIFKGDIVCIRNLANYQNGDVKYVIVKWSKKRIGWNIGEYKKPMHTMLVVGNIYENSERLRLIK